MKYLGIDWGTKYIGLAISDEEGKYSFPYDVLKNKNESYVCEELSKIIKKENIKGVVIGLPYKLSGEKGFSVEKIENFVEKLKNNSQFCGIEFCMFDERLTTKLVEKELLTATRRKKNRKDIINKASAQKILQDYLDLKNIT